MTRSRSDADDTTRTDRDLLTPADASVVGFERVRSMPTRSIRRPVARSIRADGGPAVCTIPPETV